MTVPVSISSSAPRPDKKHKPKPRRRETSDRTAAAILLAATVLALLWANSPWGATYEEFWSLPLEVGIGDMVIEGTLHTLVNDGIMTFFFFLVGLEVKREFAIGELTDRSRALVPIVAALAGLVVPALLFIAVAASSGYSHAWGVVISTDTAFLLGALAIIAPRFPQRLRTFMLTLAVVDDVGALLAIAFFYNSGVEWVPLIVSLALIAALALVRRLPAGAGFAYAILGVALWFALHAAGVHATLAGVAVALLIPVFSPRRRDVERASELTRAFRESPSSEYAAAVTRSLRDSISINERLQRAWGPYISLLVLPLFALANAGVHIDGDTVVAALGSMLFWGIIAGLVVGKLLGIFGATALVRATGRGTLAPGLGLPRIAGGAALSGIGFTISLFLVDIAIEGEQARDLARLGVLTASVVAFALGWVIFVVADRVFPPRPVGKKLSRPVDPARDHVRGPIDAPLEIVEYGDFECPFCGRATGSIDAVFDQLGDRVRWVWRHLPLDAVHPHAQQAAQAFEAAALQGRFLEMGSALFAQQNALTTADLFALAERLGLDMARFGSDFDSPAVQRRIEDDRIDAEYMDLNSTPTFFVNGVRLIGPYDSASLIAALERTAPNRTAPNRTVPE